MSKEAKLPEERGPLHAPFASLMDFPLLAMVIAVALFLVSASLGELAGSAIMLSSTIAQSVARNAVTLSAVLLTYKLAIARLGACPRDDLKRRGAFAMLGLGMLAGFLLMAASVGAAAILHVYRFVDEGDSADLLHALVTSAIMPAFIEEILFRGILFRWLEELAGSWAALAATSALFGLAHILNPHANWFSSLSIALEAGLLLGGAYMLTRSLWFPIGLHGAWNFTQGEIFGVPVSGEAVHGLLRARMDGPPIMSGGGFGLEASLIALVIATAAGLWFAWLSMRRGQVVRPLWVRRSRS